ncbi:unnamed protein product [Prorocentrum cordatum]|uniref:Vacuolar protein sorting-associated protein 13 VPS13 adaptor binding domain-containing protein n=1 Tax=Prorocentrum cordatum TaxID=2364126 RepID=A0ABN9QPA6_9DINO|nr:unnamed protein product [Polarella glacialis]
MVFSSFELELLPGPDRHTERAITATLLGGRLATDIESGTDHRRLPSARWSLAVEAEGMWAADGDLRIVDFGAVRLGEPPAVALSVRNRLEPERTVVSVSLASQPLEVRISRTLLPRLQRFAAAVSEEGHARCVIEHVLLPPLQRFGLAVNEELSRLDLADERRAPHPLRRGRSGSSSVGDEEHVAGEDGVLSIGEQWLQSDRGKEVLAGAQARIPDALELHVALSGPRLRLPVPGNRGLWVSSGSMLIRTPRACTMEAVELTLTLSDMNLAATDHMGLRHDVVAPFELQATLQTKADAVEIGGTLDGLQLKASPEIVQILALAPQSALAALRGSGVEVPCGVQVAPKQPVLPTAPTTLFEGGAESEPGSELLAARWGIREGSRLAAVRKRAQEALRAAAHEQRALVVQKIRTLHVNFRLGPSVVLFEDALNPVIRLHVASDALEVAVNTESLDIKATLMLQVGMDVFSVRVGRFEPLVEPFTITCQAARAAEEGQSVKVFGHRPLMLNATPTAIKQLAWYVPHLVSMLSPSLDDTEVSTAPRFRVLNLTGRCVALGFPGAAQRESVRIDPHTGEWRSMDRWVFPERCEQVELDSGPRLSLTRIGSVWRSGPDDDAFLWQLLRPRADYALLLVSPQCLLLNATSLPLRVRTARGSAPLPCTHCSGAALLLGSRPLLAPGAPEGRMPAASREPLVEPGEVVGLPFRATAASPGGAGSFAQALQSQVEVSLRGGEWVAIDRLGVADRLVPVQSGQSSLLVACSVSLSAPPALVPCCWLRILPALTLVSVLPCAMEVEYRLASEAEAAARRVEVPALGRTAVYDVACPGQVALRVRLLGRLWSHRWALVGVTAEAGQREHDAEAELKGEAGAVLTVAAWADAQIVVHSPCWLVDRTGWGLTVQRGAQLPTFEGITLCAEHM